MIALLDETNATLIGKGGSLGVKRVRCGESRFVEIEASLRLI